MTAHLSLTCALSLLGLFACQTAPPTAPSTPRQATIVTSAPASAEASAPASASAPVLAQTQPLSGCAALHREWREQLFGDAPPDPEGEAELASRVSRFACSLSLDLDGDKSPETVSLLNVAGQLGLRVAWGDGRSSELGAGTKLELGPGAEELSDFNWLVQWRVAPRVKGAFLVEVLRKPQRFPAPKALGDGIVIDGGDAAEILYWSAAGWRLLPLGF